MGIISRGRAQNGQRAGTTVIAAGTKLVGDLALTDNLHIDGRIEGTVQSDAEVAIGEQGSIDGEIHASRILVSGHFQGNIEAERLEIAAGGRVDGDVVVGELIIESGAQFNGSSKIRGQEPPRQLGHMSDGEATEESEESAADQGTDNQKDSKKPAKTS
ncbi:polymer-forming cytoskeletal protein [Wenzhouxiangella sp. AB-CW3]|uniref:bactofilin family protein n=1 Tax=Wenzhouxiangella sp. AB-CW3 TaxID=2771012 RepID=UPI00168B23EA|nr:polymer-forming cytoskeletal protein [Wenzhouxiangella sp. AB-CW3]QOC23521.1 polymer-forming cytoskeletal protein [Wenzhouxiangella sp. AB-CW3]